MKQVGGYVGRYSGTRYKDSHLWEAVPLLYIIIISHTSWFKGPHFSGQLSLEFFVSFISDVMISMEPKQGNKGTLVCCFSTVRGDIVKTELAGVCSTGLPGDPVLFVGVEHPLDQQAARNEIEACEIWTTRHLQNQNWTDNFLTFCTPGVDDHDVHPCLSSACSGF